MSKRRDMRLSEVEYREQCARAERWRPATEQPHGAKADAGAAPGPHPARPGAASSPPTCGPALVPAHSEFTLEPCDAVTESGWFTGRTGKRGMP